jgi:hypothetical protein
MDRAVPMPLHGYAAGRGDAAAGGALLTSRRSHADLRW